MCDFVGIYFKLCKSLQISFIFIFFRTKYYLFKTQSYTSMCTSDVYLLKLQNHVLSTSSTQTATNSHHCTHHCNKYLYIFCNIQMLEIFFGINSQQQNYCTIVQCILVYIMPDYSEWLYQSTPHEAFCQAASLATLSIIQFSHFCQFSIVNGT